NISAAAFKSATTGATPGSGTRNGTRLAPPLAAAAGAPATTNTARPVRLTITIATLAALERRMPASTTRTVARVTTRPTATVQRPPIPVRFDRYPANPRAAVAAEALFANMNVTPARKPNHGLR